MISRLISLTKNIRRLILIKLRLIKLIKNIYWSTSTHSYSKATQETQGLMKEKINMSLPLYINL